MSKTILLTGAAGLLGAAILRQLANSHKVIACVHREDVTAATEAAEIVQLDLTRGEPLLRFFSEREIDLVINCAGAVDVDRCEIDNAYALAGNKTIVENLIAAGEIRTFRLLQISTDYVFPGDSGPNTEDDRLTPINFYGKSKQEAELAIHLSGIDATIVRVCSLYSLDPDAKPNLFNKALPALRSGKMVRAAADLWTTPTEVNDLAVSIRELAEVVDPPRILHLAAPQFISRYDFAVAIAGSHGLESRLVEPVQQNQLNLAAPRPAKAGLRSEIAERLLSHQLSSYADLASERQV